MSANKFNNPYLAAEEKRYQAPAVQRFREFVLET